VTALAAPAVPSRYLPAAGGGVDRAIRVSTAAVVLTVAGIAAYISYWHAVRHEAPHNREEVQGLFCRAVAAAR
jgi:hypothetical protein